MMIELVDGLYIPQAWNPVSPQCAGHGKTIDPRPNPPVASSPFRFAAPKFALLS